MSTDFSDCVARIKPSGALDPEMVGEVISVTKAPARDGMAMMCVTHEMGFAREIAHRVWFMDEGEILERGAPQDFFSGAAHPRAKAFLSDIHDR